MKNENNNPFSRRKFISMGLFEAPGITGSAALVSDPGKEEYVSMLTRDGQVMEVKKSLLTPDRRKKTASKKQIMSWIHTNDNNVKHG